jgi:hypothetical protein
MSAKEPPPKAHKPVAQPPIDAQTKRDNKPWDAFEEALEKVAHPTKHFERNSTDLGS